MGRNAGIWKTLWDNKTFATSADSDQPEHPHERGRCNLHADCSIWWKNISGYNITIPSNFAQLCITHTLRGLASVVCRILRLLGLIPSVLGVRKTPIFGVKSFFFFFFFFCSFTWAVLNVLFVWSVGNLRFSRVFRSYSGSELADYQQCFQIKKNNTSKTICKLF